MSKVEESLPARFSRDPLLRPMDVITPNRTQVTSRNADVMEAHDADVEWAETESNEPIASQTVPGGRTVRMLAPRGQSSDIDLGALRDIARARQGVVSATPITSQAGQHGLTPHQQFMVIVGMLVTSTFGVAYAVANFL